MLIIQEDEVIDGQNKRRWQNVAVTIASWSTPYLGSSGNDSVGDVIKSAYTCEHVTHPVSGAGSE